MSTDSRAFDHHPLALEVCSCSPSTIRVLESPVRRRILCVLLERRTVAFRELTSALSRSSESVPSDDDLDDQHALLASLHHTHVPKLERAELVSVHSEDDVLSLDLHPDIYRGPLTAHLLRSVDQEVWAAVAAVYRDNRRGAVLTLLAQSGPTQTMESLASRLVESSVRGIDRSVSGGRETKADVEITLHHVHLPVLANVGLVDYDVTSGEVTYTGNRWFELGEFVETLPPRMRVGV
ncbi:MULTISPECIES: hypothetical protein [Haloferax]|uniref:DUF7344 domain-containing protein n=2 Tax=Haloferax TaxID=2251 RepID=A0A6G1YZF7_9EURY|nr:MULTISPECIES: hypothetical protein [Haloferax]KAB1186939.1 hypothetical protein Hfx1149_02400 [Haloferax sp. CBA1149]MRW79568.1 hypothetical protein [Haloferax marinisediminis]